VKDRCDKFFEKGSWVAVYGRSSEFSVIFSWFPSPGSEVVRYGAGTNLAVQGSFY